MKRWVSGPIPLPKILQNHKSCAMLRQKLLWSDKDLLPVILSPGSNQCSKSAYLPSVPEKFYITQFFTWHERIRSKEFLTRHCILLAGYKLHFRFIVHIGGSSSRKIRYMHIPGHLKKPTHVENQLKSSVLSSYVSSLYQIKVKKLHPPRQLYSLFF